MSDYFVPPTTPLASFVVQHSFERIAVLSDVHGNLPALEACLADVAGENVEAIISLGDFTWGPKPREVLGLARSFAVPTWFVRGNAERAVIDMAAGERDTEAPVDEWMIDAHGPDAIAELANFAPTLDVTLARLGSARFCHGSPRSDIELITPGTAAERIEQAVAGVPDPIIGHGHTHVQYRRTLGARTIFGPGSVGIPYGIDGIYGARWALLDADIHLRISPYDIDDAIEAARSVGYPPLERYETFLRNPPTLAEIEADAKELQFAD